MEANASSREVVDLEADDSSEGVPPVVAKEKGPAAKVPVSQPAMQPAVDRGNEYGFLFFYIM